MLRQSKIDELCNAISMVLFVLLLISVGEFAIFVHFQVFGMQCLTLFVQLLDILLSLSGHHFARNLRAEHECVFGWTTAMRPPLLEDGVDLTALLTHVQLPHRQLVGRRV